jgi:hypothetical protein
MQVGFYGHVRQYHNLKAEIDANIAKVLESGEYVHGPMNQQFEKELAAFHGMKYAIGNGSGTDAIWLALMALGIGPGDEVITNGGWRAVTRTGGYQSGPGVMDYVADMPPYIQQMADWLDDDQRVHPCALAHAYSGFEIMAALYRSAAEGGQISLPLTTGADEIALLKEKVPARKVLFSIPESAKEFPG